jgi:hypothetical protein
MDINYENLKKNTNFFGFSTKSHKNLRKKIEKIFFGYLTRYSIPFFEAKKFSKFFWLQLEPGTTIEKKIKKHR